MKKWKGAALAANPWPLWTDLSCPACIAHNIRNK